ncbi:hypothetical protein OG342_32295 [Streptomyces bobili]|uniref:hypothetical protein n=1 Tax=Streptomyces bobili TaxID=67280 RepID=UPI0022573F31|nr:hypothetical protein [Streptomyces bobili]MCX5527482.1 hypothetical protein [Streptomyces bobili]
MALDQLPGQLREFANYLDGLLARLDQGAGWCAVFWQRDPDGMRACLDGREVPPWDVMEALLQDLAANYGTPVAAQQAQRARPLHIAALAAHDAGPGARDALGDRLDVMLREQRYAVDRQAELGRLLAAATTREEAEAIRLDLAWAHDDHERATARCAELRYRIAELDRRAGAGAGAGAGVGGGAGGGGRTDAGVPVRRAETDAHGYARPTTAPAPGDPHTDQVSPYGDPRTSPASPYADSRTSQVSPYAEAAATAPAARNPEDAGAYSHEQPHSPQEPHSGQEAPAGRHAPDDAAPASVPRQRKRRRGGARFAGMAEEEAAPLAVPPVDEPVALPAPAPSTRRTPRGARFAGAAEEPRQRPEPSARPVDTAARRETAEAVERLVRLRGEGRSGEAHALLVEFAYWPAARIPLLAAGLQRSGLTADWTTLLWEAASLPADRLVAAADALAEAGRTADGEQILRQGVARPAEEIGEAVGALMAGGRRREVRALLDAYVRVRTPEEAARSVAPDPQLLVPLLLEAARGVSDERHWDLVHALRVAGFTT